MKLDGFGAARQFFSACFSETNSRLETLWVAHLSGEAHCLHLSHYSGDERGIEFPLRAIIVDAARHASAAILLAHNHPSGDPHPSESDLRATRRLATVAQAIECRLLDHLLFAGAECASLRRLGYL